MTTTQPTPTASAAPVADDGTCVVAVDVGGTFTDVCVLSSSGGLAVAKVPSTPSDPMIGVLNGIERSGVDLGRVSLISHGTTVATNALITRRFPPSAMVTTAGFRDVIEIGRGTRDDLWDAYKDNAKPYVRRRDRLEVGERVDFAGTVLEPLDEDAAREVARVLREREVQTVAVCFLNSFANPANEQRMREILEQELPGVRISLSSDVLPEIFEHERFSTTVANAVLSPLVADYVSRLGASLKDRGYAGDLVILHSGGGVMTPRTVERYAVRLAASGLAAGAIANQHIAALCGHQHAIGLDVGGTSTDISLVHDGEVLTTKEWSVEYGYPIRFPSIEVLTVGAGGGSLAWIDEAGALRNGPQSAGADPGPACYGGGGGAPTNTDANVVLGRLGTELLAGAMTLDGEAAAAAVREQVAEPLGLDLVEAAQAVLRVANANMADAVRLMSIRRGYDPRDFALLAFGGAGPLHGAAVARELGIPTVVVPPNPGVTSAFGCLLVDVRHDFSAMFGGEAATTDVAAVERDFRALEETARERLRAEGVPEDDIVLTRSIDMRYRGQWRSLPVTVDAELTALDDAVEEFHREHEREHAFRHDTPVELYQLNLRAVGLTTKPELPRHEPVDGPPPPPDALRAVVWDDTSERIETPVYRRDRLPAGTRLLGPTIIEQLDSTVVVPPGVRVEVDAWLNIRMHLPEADDAR
jgi:N-methylhydantoinase A